MYMCVCLPVSTITQQLSNILLQEFVRLMDIARGQIDKILVKFGWKLDEKLAEVCLALPGRVN